MIRAVKVGQIWAYSLLDKKINFYVKVLSSQQKSNGGIYSVVIKTDGVHNTIGFKGDFTLLTFPKHWALVDENSDELMSIYDVLEKLLSSP